MAEEKKREGGKKKHLVSIHTHRVRGKDGKVDPEGGFVHEHHYEDAKGEKSGPHYGGVSTDLADLQQHMQDHFGPDAEQQEPDQDDAEAAAPAAGAGAPPAQ
jgi:hypothetical protein